MSDDTGDDRREVSLGESYTEMTEPLLPNDTNVLGRALGGAVLHWMDMCGAIAASRFSNERCVTASMDHVDFISPIDLGEIAVIDTYVFNTGQTSMDVRVEVRAEDPTAGEDRRTTSSFLTFVAIDSSGTPTRVPELVCEDESEAKLRDTATTQRIEKLDALNERLR
jgi:acyl-CoA hydrolase